MTQESNANAAKEWMQSLSPYIDDLLLNAAPWVLLFAGCGFILAVVLILFLYKKKLLSRHIKVWHLLSKLIYVVILVAFPLFGGIYGAIYSFQYQITETIDSKLLPVATAQMPAVRTYLAGHLKNYQPNQMLTSKDMVEMVIKDFYYVPTSNSAAERLKAKWINDFILKRSAAVLTQKVQEILLAKVEALGGSLKEQNFRGQENGEMAQFGVDLVMKLTSDSVKEVDFTTLDRQVPNILTEAFKRMVKRYFTNIYIMVTMILLFFLGLITAEIKIYRRYYLPKAQAALAEEAIARNSISTPLKTNTPPLQVTENQKRLNAAKDSLKVLFGSWLVLIAVSFLVVIFALMTESDPFLGWWLIGVNAFVGILFSGVMFLLYIGYRRKIQPGCKPKHFLAAYAVSLILFRLCGISYLQGMRGSVLPAFMAISVIWFVLFSLCLVGLKFILKKKQAS